MGAIIRLRKVILKENLNGFVGAGGYCYPIRKPPVGGLTRSLARAYTYSILMLALAATKLASGR